MRPRGRRWRTGGLRPAGRITGHALRTTRHGPGPRAATLSFFARAPAPLPPWMRQGGMCSGAGSDRRMTDGRPPRPAPRSRPRARPGRSTAKSPSTAGPQGTIRAHRPAGGHPLQSTSFPARAIQLPGEAQTTPSAPHSNAFSLNSVLSRGASEKGFAQSREYRLVSCRQLQRSFATRAGSCHP